MAVPTATELSVRMLQCTCTGAANLTRADPAILASQTGPFATPRGASILDVIVLPSDHVLARRSRARPVAGIVLEVGSLVRTRAGPLSRGPPAGAACLAVQSDIGVFMSLVTNVLFADRSRLIEISEARTTFGKNLRPQLDRVCAQIGINGLPVEVAGEFYFQPGLL